MHEHRTIPQRLNDHDVFIAQLLDRVEALEAQLKQRDRKPPTPKEET
jgi:hypothetical protein